MNTLRISLIALGIALGLYACSTEEFEGRPSWSCSASLTFSTRCG